MQWDVALFSNKLFRSGDLLPSVLNVAKTSNSSRAKRNSVIGRPSSLLPAATRMSFFLGIVGLWSKSFEGAYKFGIEGEVCKGFLIGMNHFSYSP